MSTRAAIFALFFFGVPVLRAGEVLDRIVATVNGRAILQSEWQDEVRYECFVAGRAPQSLTPQDRKGALNRLIDQELLREQMRATEFESSNSEEVEKQIEAVKDDYARDHTAQAWSTALSTYHLTEGEVKNHLALELSQLRLVDAHLRPAIQVDDTAIEAYYKDHLAGQVAGGQPATLQQATPKIRELLIQEKMNQLLGSWLESLHSQAQIRILVSDSPETQGLEQ